MKLNTPSPSRVDNYFCLQQHFWSWFLLFTQRTSGFYCHQVMVSHPGPATHLMLTSHRSVTHAISYLFFFTVASTASSLLVWKRLLQIQDVLPLFTWNNQLGLHYFSQWFKCFLSTIAKCIFIPESIHHKRKTVKYTLDVFSVSLSEMRCSVWLRVWGKWESLTSSE